MLVIGAGGDRDTGKRPVMGEIGARLADVLVVTDDNPRTEDPAAIRAAVLAGARRSTRPAEVLEIGDRRTAIRRAVEMARAGDTVVIAGKGHETGQEIAGTVHPFDDRDELRAALTERAAALVIAMTLEEVADIVGGRLVDAAPTRPASPGPAFLDSRDPEPGGLFVAFAGEHVDGHDYAVAAVEGGAAAVLGTRATGAPTVLVDDARAALQELARAVLQRLREEHRSGSGSSRSPAPRARPRPRTCWPACSPTPAPPWRPPGRSTTSSACR